MRCRQLIRASSGHHNLVSGGGRADGQPDPSPTNWSRSIVSRPGGFLYYTAFSGTSQELFSDYAGDQCCFQEDPPGERLV
jgi:hypothetical protein